MKIIETPVKDAFVIESERHSDHRGFFQEIYNETFAPGATPPLQINWSYSRENVVRGIHKVPFYKLCTCVAGELWDVVVDLRKDSPTYLKWYGIWLNPEKTKHLLIPPNCGHGFFAATEGTVLIYIQGGGYDPAVQESVHYKDPTLNITWPQPSEGSGYIVSDKDLLAPYVK